AWAVTLSMEPTRAKPQLDSDEKKPSKPDMISQWCHGPASPRTFARLSLRRLVRVMLLRRFVVNKLRPSYVAKRLESLKLRVAKVQSEVRQAPKRGTKDKVHHCCNNVYY